MTLICGLDFETTGLLPEEDRVIEIGAVLYEWENSTSLMFQSALVRPGRPIPEEIIKITGITDEQVDLFGVTEDKAFKELHSLMAFADYAMAFNGTDFDHLFYLAACKRLGVEPSGAYWLDASADVKYPPEIKTRNLRHLASEHGFLNPLSHRAVFDVLTMFRVAQSYSLDEIIARAKEPTFYVQAVVTFADNQKAKDFSFRWHPASKCWWRGYKQSDFLEVKDKFDFATKMLDGPLE